MRVRFVFTALSTLVTGLALTAASNRVSVSAASRRAQERVEQAFRRLDRNGDGKVSGEQGGSLPFFDAADKNRDGFRDHRGSAGSSRRTTNGTAHGTTACATCNRNHSYTSGGSLEAHFGLGKRDRVTVRVTLPGGREAGFAGLKVDRIVDLDIASRRERSAR
ncbi:MAG: hypothetical protein FJX72_14570 [Armatimonadetes bacterium]|nr:hypothetical protein [Armatimonadota bacterium]